MSTTEYASATRNDFSPERDIAPDSERQHGVDADVEAFIADDPSREEFIDYLGSVPRAARIQLLFGVTPYDYQRSLINRLGDHDVARAAIKPGRQVGKTLTGAALAADDALFEKGEDTLIAAPFQETADEMMRRAQRLLEEADRRLDAYAGLKIGCPSDDRNKREWEFAHGGRLLSRTLGVDGVGQRGKNPRFVIVDEAAYVSDSIFEDVIEPFFLTHDSYTFILTSTPAGDAGYFYERVETDDDWLSPYWPSAISPQVSPQWLAEKQEKTEQRTFDQEYLGQFIGSSDRFFPPELVDAVTDEDAVLRDGRTVGLAADIARAGDDRTVIVAVDDLGTVEVQVSDNQMSLTDATGELSRLYSQLDAGTVLVDETGMGAGVVEMLEDDIGRHAVNGVKFTLDGKQSMYNNLKADMEDGDIALVPHPRLRRELKKLTYSYTGSGKTKIQHPDGGHDDHADALALVAKAKQQTTDSGDILAFQYDP